MDNKIKILGIIVAIILILGIADGRNPIDIILALLLWGVILTLLYWCYKLVIGKEKTNSTSIIAQINDLAELNEKGALTQEEFDSAKKNLLGKLNEK